jgi:microcystin-dependent protein
MANTYLFLNNGTAQSFATTYSNVDTFKIDSKFDVANTGEVKVYKTLRVEKNLIVSGNATISGVINSIPTGVIVMWSGAAAAIPSGWYLCDGTNGTPNLRDRFVVGAGTTYAVGDKGGTANTAVVGHTHTATSSVTDPGHKHWISSMATDDRNITGTGANSQEYGIVADAGSYSQDDPNKSTGRYNLAATTGVTVSTTVSSTGSSGTNTNLPPYYALCFIMKA